MGIKYPYYYCVNKECKKYGQMVKKKDIHDEFYDYLTVTKPHEEYLPLFKVIFMTGYKEYEKDFKGDYLRRVRDLERLKQEKKEIGIKGAKGIYPDLTLKEMLSDYEQKILLAQNSLNENDHEEQEIEPLLDRSLAFIRTLEKGWSDLPPENKPILQRVIYPEGVSYHYKGFSNPRTTRAFALINEVATSSSTNVTPSGFEPL
ncbi:hypothetical protein HY612_00550 [Candidatus Roizmanbacteria bacterium]|nr:hypothetical protein [Candidatus Roizmanbacteria bacterium]